MDENKSSGKPFDISKVEVVLAWEAVKANKGAPGVDGCSLEIHRGSFRSVKDLNAKIRAFITDWNDRCHPFVWTKTAKQVLKKANRKKTSNAGHWS